MTEEQAFIATIIESPQDDGPRLMFADWLDEHGQEERAEFICVQCTLAALPEYPQIEGHIVEHDLPRPEHTERTGTWRDALIRPGRVVALVLRKALPHLSTNTYCSLRHQQRDDSWIEVQSLRLAVVEGFDTDHVRATFVQDTWEDEHRSRRHALRRREWELLFQSKLSWTAGIPNGFWVGANRDAAPSHVSLGFLCRGFVAEIVCSCSDWLQYGPVIVRRQPVERVRLSDKKPERALGGSYFWARSNTERAWALEAALHDQLLDRLPDKQYDNAAHYSTPEQAQDALSNACLLYAKESECTSVR